MKTHIPGKILIWFFVLLLPALHSCTVQKRLYRPGLHIESRAAKNSSKKEYELKTKMPEAEIVAVFAKADTVPGEILISEIPDVAEKNNAAVAVETKPVTGIEETTPVTKEIVSETAEKTGKQLRIKNSIRKMTANHSTTFRDEVWDIYNPWTWVVIGVIIGLVILMGLQPWGGVLLLWLLAAILRFAIGGLILGLVFWLIIRALDLDSMGCMVKDAR